MRRSGQRPVFLGRTALVAAIAFAALVQPAFPQTKPTGSPLVLSSIETEQEVPLAILLPDGKTARCVPIRLHWNSDPNVGPHDEAASFTVDLPAENPATPIFTAQLWNASLASALAWQTPWGGARWKVLQTPVCDGTGIDAALAVGMIATSARRAYPPKTVVIGSLNPDGSLGPVSHLVERLNAASSAGITRVIIPSVQRFDTDASGQVVNIVRHAGDLHLECIPVDDLTAATETTMDDPLPDTQLDSSVPKYSNEVASYIDDFAHHEQNEALSGLKFAPKETELAAYPPRLAAIWKSVYADYEAGEQAYRAGQVGVAYHLFCRANGRMNGANALSGQTRINFDVKTALSESDELHDHLQTLMNPPAVDRGELQSALLVAEMADWAYEIDAALEGSQLVAKQAFSVRSDATEAEKDRAREAILFANAQCKYLLTQAAFYTGLDARVTSGNPINVDENAAHLLPQLIPAQLAIARHFTDGIRASDLRDGLLFDPRLVAYINVLRQEKADWDARQRKKDIDTRVQAAVATATAQTAATGTTTPVGNSPVKLNSNSSDAASFDPGDTYRPPHTVVATVDTTKKTSDAALCLIWVNHDCEIATLDQKYLRLNGTMDPLTHEWKLKDRARLDALLQMAEIGARHGIAFAQKAEVNPSVLAMIYERAAHDRIQGDDASALAALRNYWRCALLGNVCWQLAHTQKAQPVEAAAPPVADTKTTKTDEKKSEAKQEDETKKAAPAASTNVVVVVNPPNGETTTKAIVTPVPPVAVNPPASNPPVVPIATVEPVIPVAPIAAHEDVAPTPAPAPTPTPAPVPAPVNRPAAVANPTVVPVAPAVSQVETPRATPVAETPPAPTPTPAPTPMPTPAANAPGNDDANVPVAPIAKVEDYSGPPAATTNAPPAIGPIPPSHTSDNADSHGGTGF